MTTARTANRDATRAWRGDDFADWLPPVLVKELRQGAQSGVFFWTFLLLQGTLFVIFSLHVLASRGEPQPPGAVDFLCWLTSFLAVAVVVPLRGLGALGGERRGDTLELLQGTRLSSTRIVVDTWTALVAQSLLVAATFLPYIVIRHYLGDAEVPADLQRLGWIVAVAVVLAAAAIALSSLPAWLRTGILVVAAGGAFLLFISFMEGALGRWWAQGGLSWHAHAGLLAAFTLSTVACLEFAAARIAPPAENHAVRQRLLALIVAAAWPVAGWLGSEEAAVATFLATGPVLGAAAVGAVVGRPSRVRTLFTSFRRAGRAAATVFAPGWATGLVFVAILAAVCLAGWCGFVQRFVADAQRPVWLAFASLLLAAVVCPLPFAALRTRHPLLLFCLVQILCLAVFVVANALKPTGLSWDEHSVGRWATLPFPLGAACALHAVKSPEMQRALAPTATIAAVAVIGAALAVMFRPWLRELAAVGRLVRGDALPPASSGPAAVAVRRQPADRPWVWREDDFPDWVPPMLVRELRRGMQSGVFAWMFIGIQGAMFAMMAWAVSSFDGDTEASSGELVTAFWGAIAAAVAVVVPLRGLTAVSGERLSGNLDLVWLTRLSATKIVVGTWLALMGQVLLVAVTLLPYLALRYFCGGIDVVVELELFGWTVAGAMVVASAAIALSTLPVWARIVIVAVVVVVFPLPVVGLLKEVSRSGPLLATFGLAGRLLLLAGVVLPTVACLEFAAARIAPPAENHAARMRLIALVVTATWTTLMAAGNLAADVTLVLAVLLAGPMLLCYEVGALLERPTPLAAIYRPFGRWGLAGRLAAAVFTPGWATAVPFVAAVTALFLPGWLMLFAREQTSTIDIALVPAALAFVCLVAAALVFPLPVLVHWPKLRFRLAAYGLAQLGCLLVFAYLAAVAPRDRSLIEWGGWWFALPFPLASLGVWWTSGDVAVMNIYVPILIQAAAATTVVVLSLVARPWVAEMRRVMRLVGATGRQPRSP